MQHRYNCSIQSLQRRPIHTLQILFYPSTHTYGLFYIPTPMSFFTPLSTHMGPLLSLHLNKGALLHRFTYTHGPFFLSPPIRNGPLSPLHPYTYVLHHLFTYTHGPFFISPPIHIAPPSPAIHTHTVSSPSSLYQYIWALLHLSIHTNWSSFTCHPYTQVLHHLFTYTHGSSFMPPPILMIPLSSPQPLHVGTTASLYPLMWALLHPSYPYTWALVYLSSYKHWPFFIPKNYTHWPLVIALSKYSLIPSPVYTEKMSSFHLYTQDYLHYANHECLHSQTLVLHLSWTHTHGPFLIRSSKHMSPYWLIFTYSQTLLFPLTYILFSLSIYTYIFIIPFIISLNSFTIAHRLSSIFLPVHMDTHQFLYPQTGCTSDLLYIQISILNPSIHKQESFSVPPLYTGISLSASTHIHTVCRCLLGHHVGRSLFQLCRKPLTKHDLKCI